MGSKRRGAIAQPCGRDRGAVDLKRRRALETKKASTDACGDGGGDEIQLSGRR